MDPNKFSLNQSELKKVVFCAFIMSGVDGYIDDDEVDVIREFTENNWKDEFGDIDDFFVSIDAEVVDVLVPVNGKFNLEEKFITDILKEMSIDIVIMLKGLMTQVMEADGVIDPAEVSLIKVINRYIEQNT